MVLGCKDSGIVIVSNYLYSTASRELIRDATDLAIDKTTIEQNDAFNIEAWRADEGHVTDCLETCFRMRDFSVALGQCMMGE